MTIKNIFSKIKSKLIQNREFVSISVLFGVTFAGIAVLGTIPRVEAYNKPYDTQITFNKGNTDMLAISESKTNIIPGVSQADMDDFNQNPTPEKIQEFMKSIASNYNIDWRLVYAIGSLESGNFRSSLANNQNNYFGRKASSGGYASWNTPAEAIHDQFAYLNRRYIAIGLDTPEKMNHVYAESPTLEYKVNSIMASL